MRSLRKLVGIVLLGSMSILAVPVVFAGPQESPGVTAADTGSTRPQDAPVATLDSANDLTTELILYVILKAIP